MTPAGLPGLVADAVGNDAAWALSFRTDGPDAREILPVGSADYHAEIEAGLPGGLDGGVYTFAIEGLTDEHHALIAQHPSSAARAACVDLYLYWRDSARSAAGWLAGVADLLDAPPPPEALVARLSVLGVSRRLGARRYETVVKAVERVHHHLAVTRLDEAVDEPSMRAAILELADRAGLTGDVEVYGLTSDGNLPTTPSGAGARVVIPRGPSCAAALLGLAERLEQASGKRGRGMVLIRGGRLHVGPRRIPLTGAPVALDPAAGLLEVEALEAAGARRQFRLTLKGRSDLHPGDVVECELPPEEGGARLQASVPWFDAATRARLYVVSVQHRLGRIRAYVTVLTAIEASASDEWDAPEVTDGAVRRPATAAETGGREAGPAQRAAHAVRGIARDVTAATEPVDIGEVREATGAQALTVWRGLAAPDGREAGARRLAIEREHPSPLTAVPYLTPFAWGGCGLVLPRYPGTRVALAHRQGRPEDPVEIGATWEDGQAPSANPGDWWLSLPAGVTPDSARASIAPSETPPTHNGPVTHDLIDADGNRVIEVGELVVRAGRASLGQAGARPARGTEDAITIEHTGKGSRIVIEQDGTITIDAKADLSLLAAGDVTLSGANVNVLVDGTMDVSER